MRGKNQIQAGTSKGLLKKTSGNPSGENRGSCGGWQLAQVMHGPALGGLQADPKALGAESGASYQQGGQEGTLPATFQHRPGDLGTRQGVSCPSASSVACFKKAP